MGWIAENQRDLPREVVIEAAAVFLEVWTLELNLVISLRAAV